MGGIMDELSLPDVMEYQHLLACHKFASQHNYNVDRRSFSFDSKQDVQVTDVIKAIRDFGCRVNIDEGRGGSLCIVHPNLVGSIYVKKSTPIDIDEDYIPYYANESIKNTDMTKNLTISIVQVDDVTTLELLKVIVNLGFIESDLAKSTNEAKVTFAFPSSHGILYSSKKFNEISLESIKHNYEASVIKKARDLVELSKTTSHGLALISGPAGTGKSYLIRALLSEMKRDRLAIVCSPPTRFLVEAGMLNEVMSNQSKSLIVLEDIGEVVSVEASVTYQDARANLLNFSEGLMSLLTDAIIIISFNQELGKIDKAITRPGRCLSNIVVDKLPYEHAKNLVKFEIPNNHYALSEIYEMNRLGKALEMKKDTFGFGGR